MDDISIASGQEIFQRCKALRHTRAPTEQESGQLAELLVLIERASSSAIEHAFKDRSDTMAYLREILFSYTGEQSESSRYLIPIMCPSLVVLDRIHYNSCRVHLGTEKHAWCGIHILHQGPLRLCNGHRLWIERIASLLIGHLAGQLAGIVIDYLVLGYGQMMRIIARNENLKGV